MDMLDPVLAQSHVREKLECANADAVWLRLYKKSQYESSDEIGLKKVQALIGKLPVGKLHWHFVRVRRSA